MLVADKVAIVTGGARGIGEAIARRLLEEGARVVVSDVDDDAGEATVERLSALGPVTYVGCDVGERLDVRNLMAATLDAYGDLDIAVNNAGVLHLEDFLTLSEEDFDRVLRVNLKGSFLVGQAAARHLVDKVKAGGPAGSIVNMSSINALVAIPNNVAYSVSKGGVAQLTRVMALALAPWGIRVNAVGPGSIQTDMLGEVMQTPEARRKVLMRTPLGRAGSPAEVAAIVAFLASEQASYVTGETIYCDGGRLALNGVVPVKE